MINQSGKLNKRISLLFLTFFALLLCGCNPTFKGEYAQPASALAIAAGNVENGRDLFMGYAHFQNDGPPCMGCHSVGENGLLGGGAMGPDLTNVSTRRSDTEILGILSTTGEIISPVMQPIYEDFPLTAQEQADLLAFVKSSAGQSESDKELLILGISLAGFVAAVVVLGFIYRGRLRGVRKAMVKNAQAGK